MVTLLKKKFYCLLDDIPSEISNSSVSEYLRLCTNIAEIPLDQLYISYQSGIWHFTVNSKPIVTVPIDYTTHRWTKQRLQQNFSNSLLHKALGKGKNNKEVLDASAGLGRDSVIMHALDYKVTACEQHPLIFFVVQQAMQAAGLLREHSSITQRGILLYSTNSVDYLIKAKKHWQCIYIDPMFQRQRSKAQVKKSALILRMLVEETPHDDIVLFAKARQHCSRLVVKRHRHAPLLTPEEPNVQFVGQSTRFDVYLQ